MPKTAIDLPEEIACELTAAWKDIPPKSLETVTVEGYCSAVLTRRQARSLLVFSFWETEAFLNERQAYLPYRRTDLDQGRADLGRVFSN